METLKKSEKIDILERAQKAYWLRGIGGLGDLKIVMRNLFLVRSI